MKFSHFFIKRPIFASVLSIFIVIVGVISLYNLPIASFPDVAPPTIFVRAQYPGASAQTVADTVAVPLMQEINGVENMLYMSSACSSDGSVAIQVTFKVGTDIDMAQVQVQNRVQIALPRLPEEVRRLGVDVRKRSPSMTIAVAIYSPDKSLDEVFISNYAYLQIKDVFARLPGVGDVFIYGARDYSMRIWIDPEKAASRNLTASEIVAAIREQNIEVAGGVFGQQPAPPGVPMQLVALVKGRLASEKEFGDIIVKTEAGGKITRLRDVARIELGARDYSMEAYVDGVPMVALAVFQLPGSNTIETADAVRRTIEELSKRFPKGLTYKIMRDDSEYIRASINEVVKTLIEAMVLVIIVVILFLQTWRASLIPIVAVPVSIIGTFAVMAALGFSINNLTLFGLVLAIGIVVDDAIVVVENVERHIAEGKDPVEATKIAMEEISGAIVAIALVLSAVFIPTAFLPGIQGKFYQQFALTIAVSTIISAFNALTLSPALCALLLQPHHEKNDLLTKIIQGSVGWIFTGFNKIFDSSRSGYLKLLKHVIRHGVIVLILYGGLLGLTYFGFREVPTGFIPQQDKGGLIVYLQLPDGASLERTREVSTRIYNMIKDIDGIFSVVKLDGYSMLSFGNKPNATTFILRLKSFEERKKKGITSEKILAQVRPRIASITEGVALAFNFPAVDGLGSVGGFKMQIQDRANLGVQALQAAAFQMMAAANQDPRLSGVLTTFRANEPQVLLDVDREKAKTMQVPLANIWDALGIYMGGVYVNDFTLFGRPYQVWAQADAQFRARPEDVLNIKTRNLSGEMVPLGTVVTIKDTVGPTLVYHYNLYPSADLSGVTKPGVSSGDAIKIMEDLAHKILPPGMAFEWTELSLLEVMAGKSGILIFPICVLMVFLVLAAQYESWSLPFAIILITPMALLFAILAIWVRGMENNLFVQIGMVTLIGLACKNSILIVEFARQLQEKGMTRFEAALEACRLRLRPILMTSFAFTFGVLPLMIATGAGSELRRAIGTAAFWGMIGVTMFGIFLAPVFYVVIRRVTGEKTKPNNHTPAGSGTTSSITSVLLIGTIAGAILLGSGCAVGPNYKQPTVKVNSSFSNIESNFVSESISIEWWKQFNDDELVLLVEQALKNNHDLRIAVANVKEARALRNLASFDKYPTVQASGGYIKGTRSKDAAGGQPRDLREYELFDGGFDAAWELDFFGRVRRSVEASNAELMRTEEYRRYVYISVAAEVARNYFELRGAQNELEVARQNAKSQRESYEIIAARFKAGRGTELDVRRAESQWTSTEALIPAYETRIKLAIHRLGVLTGQQPTALESQLLAQRKLPAAPEKIYIGKPDELLRRRPDIRAAERALAAATARIGVATADLFPRVTFIGSIGLEAKTLSGWGEAGADTYSFGPRISWAALDIGRVKARIKAADARAEASLANYEKTVLTALEETENALVQYGKTIARLRYLEQSAKAAEEALKLAQQRYEHGITDYLTVLDAQRVQLSAQSQLAQAQTQASTALVAIYKALGGGWKNQNVQAVNETKIANTNK
ncbi:MAG: multidrug efflux RND transporter permease subunit [Verrucomicrobiia bacterium]